jgi:hypothetical protein
MIAVIGFMALMTSICRAFIGSNSTGTVGEEGDMVYKDRREPGN